MKTLLLFSAVAACALAQEHPQVHGMTNSVPAVKLSGMMGVGETMGSNVKGAPYSAIIVTEMVQTLADGNRISQKNQGSVARDSQGRMRHEAILPVIGNMSTNAVSPRVIFINDPLSGTNYNLNVSDKTYRKLPAPPSAGEMVAMKRDAERKVTGGPAGTVNMIYTEGMRMPAPPPHASGEAFRIVADGGEAGIVSMKLRAEQGGKRESLGSKVIEGVMVEGTRTTRTIAAGEIGNDKPIEIVSESWFSPDLKTVVYSKRSDPRTGDMIYSLTNISRSEPEASLFTVPADYKAAAEGEMHTFTYSVKED